ncbi:MAG: MarR family winged helix-turn-helix transcriptional regulator [Solirubrobacteraceae bacterium]
MARLGSASARQFAELLAPEGVHPRQFGVMNLVAAHPGLSQQELRELTAIDASSMVSVIDDLQALGLAERRPHPSDRRVRAIHLTEFGTETLGRLRILASELQRDFFSALSESEQKSLHQLLLKVAGAG